MTQADAKRAVRKIRESLEFNMMIGITDAELKTVVDDLKDLEARLEQTKQATPNCRPATPDELRQLCAASNVVVFPAA